jgi:hypothetical protein
LNQQLKKHSPLFGSLRRKFMLMVMVLAGSDRTPDIV